MDSQIKSYYPNIGTKIPVFGFCWYKTLFKSKIMDKIINLSNNFGSFDKMDIQNELLNHGFKIGQDYVWGFDGQNMDQPKQILIINTQMFLNKDTMVILNAISY